MLETTGAAFAPRMTRSFTTPPAQTTYLMGSQRPVGPPQMPQPSIGLGGQQQRTMPSLRQATSATSGTVMS